MRRNISFKYLRTGCIILGLSACVPSIVHKTENKTVPANYNNLQNTDSTNSANLKWKEFFTDPNLVSLIDTALKNNQELNIMLQEIKVAKNEVKARKGAYLPFVNIGAGAGVERAARYTRNGAVDANTIIRNGKQIPEPLPDYIVAGAVSWEVDIWKKLRNSKKSAYHKFLSTEAGKNFMVTHLISEISNSYYELLALDNQLDILKKYIAIQQDALDIVKLQKEAARATELAVRRFQAEVLKNQSRQYYIQQRIIETENRINYLTGRFPKPIQRNLQAFTELKVDTIQSGIPSQLLGNRPDVIQAEQDLTAAKLDVKVAKAYFYPSLNIFGGVGYEAFNPKFLVTTPESMLYNLAGGLVAPAINRNAIKATYLSSNAKQIQAAFNYERTILNAYIEVANQLSNISNLKKSYELKDQQVNALTQSITISIGLFQSARADYMDVLMTQRDALDSKFELVETKMQQMNARVNIYKALGGGWR